MSRFTGNPSGLYVQEFIRRWPADREPKVCAGCGKLLAGKPVAACQDGTIVHYGRNRTDCWHRMVLSRQQELEL